MKKPRKRTGIFGGTFNPVHQGHVAAAKSFLASGLIDELWVLLNPSPPHKKGQSFAPYSVRLAMLRAAFSTVDHTVVSDIETELPSPNYTLQTLKYLSETTPERTFFLCIGKDSFLSFKEWHQWEDILDYCELLVAERAVDEEAGQVKQLLSHTTFVKHQPVDISSSGIRNRLSSGKPIDHLVPPQVLEIINNEQLYQ